MVEDCNMLTLMSSFSNKIYGKRSEEKEDGTANDNNRERK